MLFDAATGTMATSHPLPPGRPAAMLGCANAALEWGGIGGPPLLLGVPLKGEPGPGAKLGS